MAKSGETDQKELKSDVALREEKILDFWREKQIFEQTEKREGVNGDFVFYDGPPFATGTPHFGHLLPTSLKDVIPRYQTMRGKRVLRRFGWDCHGLPVENIVEKDLDLKIKKDILAMGVDKFNEACRVAVLRYTDEWKKIIPRMGRWIDMDNDYKTMNPSYSESVWWVFKTLFDKGLVYEGYKSMQLCPRCETTLSNFEVNQGYADITDISVYVKFELVDPKESEDSRASEPRTFVLAWTTTPWTLPGNVALAVNPEVFYVKAKKEGVIYILAKDLAEKSLKEEYEIIGEFSGSDLVGKKYQPVFDYYQKDETLKNKESGWQIYPADFVTTDSGTGVVHIAPAFGEDDMALGKKYNLPFIQHVGTDGVIKPEVTDLAGRQAKPKDDHQATDVEVIKLLAGKGLLFAKEKIIHSYPHCWRCATPLLNYAASSWFVEVTKIKDELVANNKTISWVPEHIKEGRFGKWLEGARDWAISRSRFWGAPIPVWKCEACKKVEIVGSVADLIEKKGPPRNNFFFMRHGESEANIKDIVSDDINQIYNLTDKGKEQVFQSADKLKAGKIDFIFTSPFTRTKETADLMADELGLSADEVIVDERLREIKTGIFTGQHWSDYDNYFHSYTDKFTKAPPGGETYYEVSKRALEAVFDINNKYEGKNILIISHASALFMIESFTSLKSIDEIIKKGDNAHYDFQTAEVRNIEVREYPHNNHFEIDLHRPYIDEFTFACSCGGQFRRVSDVFDCWFESGSMPYAQSHYPFDQSSKFNPTKDIGFPADFIAEGLDQTRGWFYSLLVLSTALFDKPAFRNVVVNGLILAADGQKMSKSLKNYPDMDPTIDKYGADALRFYLLSSPAVKAEEFAFSETSLGETARRVIARLDNVMSFYEIYSQNAGGRKVETKNVLDIWILTKLDILAREVGKFLDSYELDRAVRVIDDFIDDLSNWYIRRSRDRFKSEDEDDKQMAMVTTKEVLIGLSKVIAPFTPFIAEDIWQKLKASGDEDSVHLSKWPEGFSPTDTDTIDHMITSRHLVEIGLKKRAEANIKVRQPLAKFSVNESLPVDYLDIIAEELNVKEVVVDLNLSESVLDTDLTEDLKTEGVARDLIRQIQEARKQKNLQPGQEIVVKIDTDQTGKKIVQQFKSQINRVVNASDIVFASLPSTESVKLGDLDFKISLD